MPNRKQRLMRASEVHDFVDEMIEAGCDICAVGRYTYVAGDMQPSNASLEEVARISEKYGDCDALRQEITAYLWSIGRYIELASESTRH
ncbi:hypothetical protein [Sinorhizobium sp. Sb3]|uniref:hypothetical protein n=1 Tax=Sinorhizobium/Ensifer group TaxID=227292 RepID=UPI000727B73F|nr:hypothetical protein [Sinorhizobium sp. Sb3]KSV77524.1 hypothetical protein N183_19345 [Sinorhizobium sp. Sb3]